VGAAEGTSMHHELLGSTHPVLTISLEPDESVVSTPSRFAWMTDSIRLTPGGQDQPLSVYTATGTAGVVAFSASRPGRVLGVEATEGYLISDSGFIAGTTGVRLQPAPGHEHGLKLWQVTGSGHAWIGLAGDPVERELTASQSLRAQRDHIGMFVPTVTIQITEIGGICVLSGPGTVWLQSKSRSHDLCE
jgi:uncharacterized protein (AIM24 family)